MAEQGSVWKAEYFNPNISRWQTWGWIDKPYTEKERQHISVPRSWGWRFTEYRRVEEEKER